VEPPGTDVPGPGPAPVEPPTVGPLRLVAAAAAAAIAVAATGHVAVLAALLAVVAARPAASAAIALAAGATIARWGAGSLAAVAGAQAVLGPAGLVGPPRAAASSWLAAAAVLLTTPGPLDARPTGAALVCAAATGVTAATLVVGPSPVADPVVRALGLLGGLLLAVAVTLLPWRRVVVGAALVAGALAAALAVTA
jgi:hypothetical protein